MRPHSHFRVNAEAPRARGVCDRCGQHWQHSDLLWQFEWIGPRLQNLRFLVCPPCYDKPQPNLRTITIPPDPLPIMNARPENYVLDDSPLSAIGVDANFFRPKLGSRIGTLTTGGGLNAAFDGTINKPSWLSACNKLVSDSSYNNYVGINWQGNVSGLSMPSSLMPPVIQHTLTSVSLYAPFDRGFLGTGNATNYIIQSSPTGNAIFGAWTTLGSGSIQGIPGEAITNITLTNNSLNQFHRVAIQGDGVNYISVAQVQFSVAEVGHVT